MESIFGVSINEVIAIIESLLKKLKTFFLEYLGIEILPGGTTAPEETTV